MIGTLSMGTIQAHYTTTPRVWQITNPLSSTAMAPQSASTRQKTCVSFSGASIMSFCSLAAEFFTRDWKFLRRVAPRRSAALLICSSIHCNLQHILRHGYAKASLGNVVHERSFESHSRHQKVLLGIGLLFARQPDLRRQRGNTVNEFSVGL